MSGASSPSTTPARKVSGDHDDSPDSRSSPHLRSSSTHRKTGSMSGRSFLGRPLVRPLPLENSDKGDAGETYQETCGARWVERQEARSLRVALQEMDLQGEDEEEERRLYEAASKEAGELVWKHQNGETAAFRNPDTDASPAGARDEGRGRRFTAHLEKGSHSRSLSRHAREGFVIPKARKGSRSVSGSSNGSSGSSRVISDGSIKSLGSIEEGMETNVRKTSLQFVVPASSAPKEMSPPPEDIKPPQPKAQVKVDIDNSSKPSGVLNSVHFRNPFARARNSRDSFGSLSRPSRSPPLQTGKFEKVEIQRNPPTQSRNPAYTTNHSIITSVSNTPETGDEEPLKVKDGKEVRSDDIRKATSMSLKDRSPKLPMPSMVSDSPGRPIVSFDKEWKPKEIKLEEQHFSPISGPREAPKSYRTQTDYESGRNSLPTRKPTLPVFDAVEERSMPSIRSDVETRPLPRDLPKTIPNPPIPIINLPDEVSSRPSASYIKPSIPVINFPDEQPTNSMTARSKPPIPIINISEDITSRPKGNPNIPTITVGPPSISINGSVPAPPTITINDTPTIPTINISCDSPTSTGARPLPKPGAKGRPYRPTAAAAATTAGGPQSPSTSHPSLAGRANAVLCHACAFPIAGRIVTAADARFHPECFRCHHCSEALECVAFYPEPQGERDERVARIRRRGAGELVESDEDDGGRTAELDGDEGMRFYCHLDFHEFFSPRCKSCKTPIEGDVIVACGAEWHAGHFFCAQCGDVSIQCFLASAFIGT